MLSGLSEYLQCFREGYKSVYYLSALGREYVGSNKVRRKNQFVNHVLLRNEYYLFADKPEDWMNEMNVSDGTDKLICDAWFTKNNRIHFLEVDRTQTMKENRHKIDTYRRMFQRGAFNKKYRYFPPVIWLTTSELRKEQLKKLCVGLPSSVYTLQDIK